MQLPLSAAEETALLDAADCHGAYTVTVRLIALRVRCRCWVRMFGRHAIMAGLLVAVLIVRSGFTG